MEDNINYLRTIKIIASNEQRIKTDKKISMFDYALIIADLFALDKWEVLEDLRAEYGRLYYGELKI